MDVNLTLNTLGERKSGNGRYELMEKMICSEQHDVPVPIALNNTNNDDDKNKKQTDFVLVFVDNGNIHHAQKREEFENELRDQGLELEYEQNRQLCFVKINAPQVLEKLYYTYKKKKKTMC